MSTDAARVVNELIGGRVRQHRTARGWTLDELADRSGVSRRMVISIEHGEGNPSIATLLRISDALGVGLPVLVDVEQPRALTVTAAGQAPVLWRGPHGGQALLVAGTQPPDVVELWDWTLHPGEEHRSEPHSAGTRELLLVLEGPSTCASGTAPSGSASATPPPSPVTSPTVTPRPRTQPHPPASPSP